MPTRRLLLALAAAVSVVLVVAVGSMRTTYVAGGQEVPCPERVWSAALSSLTEQEPGPCAAAAQNRMYGVMAGLMGLVLVSGLLSRRD